MNSKYKAIHFDMDGVIVNTEPRHVAAEQQTCLDFLIDIDTKNWEDFKGKTTTSIFTDIISEYGDPRIHSVSELSRHKTDLFLDGLESDQIAIDGILDFLNWGRDNHHAMSLVTSSNRQVQEFITETLNIRDLFDVIVTGDDVSKGKPSPLPYLMALDRTNSAGCDSIVVEDSKNGILSARRAGCDVLAITTSFIFRELTQVQPTYIIDKYPEAIALLSITD